MTLTKAHQRKRLNRVTSTTGADAIATSEHVAARRILGIDGDPFDTPLFLLRGQFFEESICNMAEHLMREGTDYLEPMRGLRLHKHPFRVHSQLDWLGTSVDRVANIGDVRVGAVEAKSYLGAKRDEFGEPGTDQVDERTYYQCVIHMAVLQLPWVRVPLDTGWDFRIYHVHRDKELEDAVLLKLERFYHRWIVPNIGKSIRDMVLPDVDGLDSTTEWIRRRYKEHTLETLAPAQRHYEIALRREQLKAQIDDLVNEKKKLDNALRNEIGATGKAGFRDELVTITWKETKGRVVTDWRAISEELGAPYSMIQQHTRTAPGHRHLYCKVKKKGRERLIGGTMQQKLALEAQKENDNEA